MAEDPPTTQQWRSLYEAAVGVKELSPWEWMTEGDVFGVEGPQTQTIGFVSVMGALGEHYAVSLYPNPQAFYGFLALEEAGPEMNPTAVLEIPQFQLSFEDRGELENRDRALIKELGFKFRGRKEWPIFRSYRPGCLPWFMEAEEARLLKMALGQLLEVAPRFWQDPSLLDPAHADEDDYESYLVRVARGGQEEGGARAWQDQVMEVPPPEPVAIEVEMGPGAVEDLGSLPQGDYALEVDLFMFPAPVQEHKESRPVLPYTLLIVDGDSGPVVGTELLQPVPTLEAMWGSVPGEMARQLAGLGVAPKEVSVRSELLYGLLGPLAELSGFELHLSPFLPALQEAREDLLNTFGS